MDTCRTCGVPFVLVQIDQDRTVATYKCPVCGYVVLVRLSLDILRRAQAESPGALTNEEQAEDFDDD